jgi:hypothetical protein
VRAKPVTRLVLELSDSVGYISSLPFYPREFIPKHWIDSLRDQCTLFFYAQLRIKTYHWLPLKGMVSEGVVIHVTAPERMQHVQLIC